MANVFQNHAFSWHPQTVTHHATSRLIISIDNTLYCTHSSESLPSKKYFIIYIYIYTVKPLYSEQSRDPNKGSLYGGVHPRGVRYVHAHMCQNYNVHMYINPLATTVRNITCMYEIQKPLRLLYVHRLCDRNMGFLPASNRHFTVSPHEVFT